MSSINHSIRGVPDKYAHRCPVNPFEIDNGIKYFEEFGGHNAAAWFLSPDKKLFQAVRITRDIALPFNRCATILRCGGVLLLTSTTQSVVAIQGPYFASHYQRAHYDGQTIVSMKSTPADQARRLIAANNDIQGKLQVILTSSVWNSLTKWRKNKQIKLRLDAYSKDVHRHIQDLKLTQVSST